MSSGVRVLSLSLLVLLGATPTASAAEGWSLVPVGGGRPSLYGEGVPGAVLEDAVAVTNRGGEPVTVRLGGPGVTFADGTVRVPGRTRAEVPFTVAVPRADRTVEIVARDGDGRRHGVQVRLRATVPEVPTLTVEHVAVRGDRIAYEVVNRGTTTLVPKLAVRADGVAGPVLDRAPRTLPVDLPPGSRTRLTEPWPDRPALDAVDVTLTVTAAGGVRDTGRTSARFVPWGAVTGAVAAVGAAVVAIGAFFAVRRRGRRGDGGGASVPPPRGEAELTGAVR